MTSLNQSELQARLEAIRLGPWIQRAELAQRELAFPGDLSTIAVGPGLPLNLGKLAVGRKALAREKRLAATLKWHGRAEGPSRREQQVRDSFDDALAYLELLELAIETNYLPQEQVAEDAQRYFLSILWSEPAQKFVRMYDYTAVETLAARLRIHGLSARPVPEVDSRGAAHFASFIATHVEIETVPDCQKWLGFMDDYVAEEDEQDDFYEFLRSGALPPSQRYETFINGASNFVVMLADFLEPLPTDLTARFGAFYSYWLAKMFGFELSRRGYVRNRELWEAGDSWARALIVWYRHQAAQDNESWGNVAELMDASLRKLREVWDQVRAPPEVHVVTILDRGVERGARFAPPRMVLQNPRPHPKRPGSTFRAPSSWSERELLTLKKLVSKGTSVHAIAKQLGRSASSVQQTMKLIGTRIRRTKITNANEE
jgi:hypothetical protein